MIYGQLRLLEPAAVVVGEIAAGDLKLDPMAGDDILWGTAERFFFRAR